MGGLLQTMNGTGFPTQSPALLFLYTYTTDKPLFLDLTVFLYNFYKAADLV